VREQTVLPDEVVIADDGSREDTEALIREWKPSFPVPLHHVWQPDEGYQLAKIRNRAFAAATKDYIIQVDGDLLLHPQFIADHRAAAKRGNFISGARALLSKKVTDALLEKDHFSWPAVLSEKPGKAYNAFRSTTLSRLNGALQRGGKNMHYVLGCNMAFWASDLKTVNGYNEAFTGWGKEDNDIAARLMNAGIRLRFLKFGGIVYHLHHPETARPLLPENEAMLRESIAGKITYVSKGMDQYLETINKEYAGK